MGIFNCPTNFTSEYRYYLSTRYWSQLLTRDVYKVNKIWFSSVLGKHVSIFPVKMVCVFSWKDLITILSNWLIDQIRKMNKAVWNNFKKRTWPGRDLNTQPSEQESDALPLRHQAYCRLAGLKDVVRWPLTYLTGRPDVNIWLTCWAKWLDEGHWCGPMV